MLRKALIACVGLALLAATPARSSDPKIKVDLFYLSERDICNGAKPNKSCPLLRNDNKDEVYLYLQAKADYSTSTSISGLLERWSYENEDMFSEIGRYHEVSEDIKKSIVLVFWINNTDNNCRLTASSKIDKELYDNTERCPGRRWFYWLDAAHLAPGQDPVFKLMIGKQSYILRIKDG